MKKKICIRKTVNVLMLGFLLMGTSCNLFGGDFDSEQNAALKTMTSTRFAAGLTNGWNLGNTFDAHNSGAGYRNEGLKTETSWGMPETTKAMIDAVSAKGFKTIRIPVSWHNHIVKKDVKEYIIDEAWMARVKQVVQWALDDGMFVILNIHHDDLNNAEMKTLYGYCVDKNPNTQVISKNYITSVWKQVATAFAGFDNRLVFEILNEPRYRDGANNGFTAPSDVSKYNEIIASYEIQAIKVIRSIPGNENRFIMVPFYAANPYSSEGWKLPEDTAKDKLIVSVHAYNPYGFAMYDGSEHLTFTDSDKGEIEWLFTMLNNQWVSKGIGVVMGEASASDKNNTSERKKWIQTHYSCSKRYGIPIILWDNMETYRQGGNLSEFHGWFNRKNCSWFFESLIDEMIRLTK